MTLCSCGCGKEVKPGRMFIHGHHRRGVKLSDETKKKISDATIGREISDEYRNNLSKSHLGNKHSDKTRKKMSDAQIARFQDSNERQKIATNLTGYKHSDEMKKNVSNATKVRYQDPVERKKTSDAMKKNNIVRHHYIYDHSDLSKYTMEMTRSAHARLHWLMRKSGIVVPHINGVV